MKMNKKKNEKGLYKGLTILLLLYILGALSFVEYLSTVCLPMVFLFCLICGIILLFCLMKLDVMDFPSGSFWDRINQYINREQYVNQEEKNTGYCASHSIGSVVMDK